jgi:hypothetical protein
MIDLDTVSVVGIVVERCYQVTVSNTYAASDFASRAAAYACVLVPARQDDADAVARIRAAESMAFAVT